MVATVAQAAVAAAALLQALAGLAVPVGLADLVAAVAPVSKARALPFRTMAELLVGLVQQAVPLGLVGLRVPVACPGIPA